MAYCGLYYHICPIYVAERESDNIKKSRMIYEIIQMCKDRYGIEYRYNEIVCDGYTSNNGRLFIGCRDCKIRQCAIDKSIENCAYCNEYVCNLLMDYTKPILMQK